MNLWQINRQGCSSPCVAQWTLCVSGSRGRCMCARVSVACVFQGNHWATHANMHRHTWKLPCFFYFCKFRACRKRMFSSALSLSVSLSLRCMVERLRQPQGCQAESHWWTTTPRHPDPSIWPLSHFYYTRITISRSPTPLWDFATVP